MLLEHILSNNIARTYFEQQYCWNISSKHLVEIYSEQQCWQATVLLQYILSSNIAVKYLEQQLYS